MQKLPTHPSIRSKVLVYDTTLVEKLIYCRICKTKLQSPRVRYISTNTPIIRESYSVICNALSNVLYTIFHFLIYRKFLVDGSLSLTDCHTMHHCCWDKNGNFSYFSMFLGRKLSEFVRINQKLTGQN